MLIRTGCLLLLLFGFINALRAEDLLARRLSVRFEQTPLRQALDEIARLANFQWVYDAGIIDAHRPVSLNARDWTIREILHELLGDRYAFKVNGRYLILKKQKPPKSTLSGVVRDPKTGERLANVTVYDQKTLRAVTTDSSGYYQLKIKKQAAIVVSRLGYRDTVLQVSSLSPRYQKIELTPVTPDSVKRPLSLQRSLQNAYNELEYFFNATLDKWHTINVQDTLTRRFQMSFLPKIGTNHTLDDQVVNDFSLNILAGHSAGVRKLEIGGLGNFTREQVTGVQIAGIFNANKGECQGVQVAGVFNQTAQTLDGVQIAGIFNQTGSSPRFYTQVAGLVNVAGQAQSSEHPLTHAVQIAGLVNQAHQLEGVQVAGLVNHTSSLSGVQVAGLFNRARKARGIQIALVNHSNELQGVQIGLINRSGKRWMPVLNWGW